MRKDRRLSVPLCLLIAGLAAGCGGQPAVPPSEAPPALPSVVVPTVPSFPTSGPASTTAPTLSPPPAELGPLIEAAKAEGQLTVIALPHDWLNYGEVIDTFSSKYGITVRERDPNAGSSMELDALRHAKTTTDLNAPDVIDVGMTFAEQARQEGLLQPYKVSTWSTIPDAAKDPDGYWYGDYYGILVFEVNPKLVASVPQDWPDLLTPGNFVALPPYTAGSYQSMMTIYSASLANGGSLDDTIPGLRFFQEVNKAGNLLKNVIVDGNTVASGSAPIALRWDYLALANRDARPSGQIVVVPPKTGIVAGVYAQGISAYAAHPNAAKLWMEFLYSDEGQMLFLKGRGHPIRFGDMLERGVIPGYMLDMLLPSDLYLQAAFPTAKQLSAADKAILAGWKSYIP
jgi:putative spermidine/putrescine transport system substrate-binding protein